MMKTLTQFKNALLLLLMMVSLATYAQDRTVSGTITDDADNPLPGVSVLAKGTQKGTTTNTQGKYSLNVPGNSRTLVFSYIGYKKLFELI